MKTFITTIFIAISLFAANRTSAQTTTEDADSAYMAGDYALASDIYEKTISENGTSASLLYNLGNSYYRQGKLPKAIIAYERALRLNPSDEMIRSNLDFVNSKLVDKKGYEGSFLSRTFADITDIMPANAWAWLSLTLFALTIGGIAVYLFTNGVMLRKIGFFSAIVLLIAFLASIVFSFNARSRMNARNVAIVTAPSSILSTSPRAPQNRNEEAMLLHEGARLTIIDSVASPVDSVRTVWYDVSFDNDHRAWINSADVEII